MKRTETETPESEAAAGLTQEPDMMKPGRKTSPAIRITVAVLRIIVGGIFIFSGWAKAVDPWGSLYKFAEYLQVFGFDFPREAVVTGACALAATEFALGMMMLTGAFRKTVTWLIVLFMTVMTPLTLWIWLSDPVADCGCFGDALIISNRDTFLKNIIICLMLVPLILFNGKVKGLIIPKVQWLAAVFSLAYPATLSVIGYNVQPLVDFRPFKVGERVIPEGNDENPVFIYEKDGVERTFSIDSIPGDDWTFVRRHNPVKTATELSILDEDGDDVTEDIMDESENGLMILAVSDPERHGISRSMMANSLSRKMENNDGQFVAIVATDTPDEWKNTVHAEYPVYTADDTDIKSLVRGDAALVYVKDGIVKWKYNLYSLPPDAEKSVNPDTLEPIEGDGTLMKISILYLIAMAVTIALSSTADVVNRHLKKPKAQG